MKTIGKYITEKLGKKDEVLWSYLKKCGILNNKAAELRKFARSIDPSLEKYINDDGSWNKQNNWEYIIPMSILNKFLKNHELDDDHSGIENAAKWIIGEFAGKLAPRLAIIVSKKNNGLVDLQDLIDASRSGNVIKKANIKDVPITYTDLDGQSTTSTIGQFLTSNVIKNIFFKTQSKAADNKGAGENLLKFILKDIEPSKTNSSVDIHLTDNRGLEVKIGGRLASMKRPDLFGIYRKIYSGFVENGDWDKKTAQSVVNKRGVTVTRYQDYFRAGKTTHDGGLTSLQALLNVWYNKSGKDKKNPIQIIKNIILGSIPGYDRNLPDGVFENTVTITNDQNNPISIDHTKMWQILGWIMLNIYQSDEGWTHLYVGDNDFNFVILSDTDIKDFDKIDGVCKFGPWGDNTNRAGAPIINLKK